MELGFRFVEKKPDLLGDPDLLGVIASKSNLRRPTQGEGEGDV